MGNIHHLSTTHYQNNSVAFQCRIFAAITFKTTFSPPEKKAFVVKNFSLFLFESTSEKI
jgi:hypothetical protein